MDKRHVERIVKRYERALLRTVTLPDGRVVRMPIGMKKTDQEIARLIIANREKASSAKESLQHQES